MGTPTASAQPPPLLVGQMVKVDNGDYQGATGVIMEKRGMEFCVQLLGANDSDDNPASDPTKVYLLPQHLKPLYLSDSPRPTVSISPHNHNHNHNQSRNHAYPEHIATQESLSLSPTPSNVSSITSPSTLQVVSSPSAASTTTSTSAFGVIKKYKSGPFELGHWVRIMGGIFKGQRGMIVEIEHIKIVVRLEHSDEEVYLMPSDLGPWERSAAHAVLKQRRNTSNGNTNDSENHEMTGEDSEQQDQFLANNRPRCSSPVRAFWSPLKKSMSDNSTLSGLRGDQIELESSGEDCGSLTENTDPLQQSTPRCANHNNSNNAAIANNNNTKASIKTNPNNDNINSREVLGLAGKDVASPNRMGSPLRRRRGKTTPKQPMSSSKTLTSDGNSSNKGTMGSLNTSCPNEISYTPANKNSKQGTPRSAHAADRSVFKRSTRHNNFKPIAGASSISMASSTASPSILTNAGSLQKDTSKITSIASRIGKMNAPSSARASTSSSSSTAGSIASKRSVPAPAPLQIQTPTNATSSRSIFKRKASATPTKFSSTPKCSSTQKAASPKSHIRPESSISRSPKPTSSTTRANTPRASTPTRGASTPKAATPAAGTSRASTPSRAASTGTPKARTPKCHTPTKVSATPTTSTPRTASTVSTSITSDTVYTSPEKSGTPRLTLREKFTFRNVETKKTVTRDPEKAGPERHGSPPPVQLQGSLSPLMLRRRARSNSKQRESTTSVNSTNTPRTSPSPRLRSRPRDTSRFKTSQARHGSPRSGSTKLEAAATEPAKAHSDAAIKGNEKTPSNLHNSLSNDTTSLLKREQRRQNRSLMQYASSVRAPDKEKVNNEAALDSHPQATSRAKESSFVGIMSSSWSLSTSSTTEAILRNYGEATRPRPTRKINIVSSQSGEHSMTSTTVTDSLYSGLESSTKESSSNTTSARSPKLKAPTTLGEKIRKQKSKSSENDSDDDETEMIIAKYNKIIERRKNMKKAQAKNSDIVSESSTRNITAVPALQQEDEPTPRSALLENEHAASNLPEDETSYISDADGDNDDGEHVQTRQSNELVNQPPKVPERVSSLSSYAAASLAVNRTASASADQNSISIKHVVVNITPHQGRQSISSHDVPHNTSPVASHQREMEYRNPLSPQLTNQPQLLTRKLMELHLLQPPPPPPPLPPQGLKSPKTPKKDKGWPSTHNVVLADPPGPPPITPKTPGGSRRISFVEDSTEPLASTPRERPKTPMMPRSPRDTFVKPSPSPSRTPTSRSTSQFVSSPRSQLFADAKSNDSHDTNSVSRDEIPAPPSISTENREEQQRKNRGVFQKSFLEATTSRPRRSSNRRDIKLSALSNSIAPPLQEAKNNITLTSPSNCVGATQDEIYSSRISSPLSVITKQSFGSPEAARRDRWKNKLLKEAGQRHPAERVSFPTSSSAVSGSGGAAHATKQKKKSLGASWQQIMQIPSRTLNRKDILCYQNSVSVSRSKALMACYLCTKNFRVKDVIRTLPCNHSFHTCCIDRFLFQQAECPMCKHPAVVLEI